MTPSPREKPRPSEPEGPSPAPGRVGVWLFGATGGLATTMVVGARAIAKKLAGCQGMLTESDMFGGVALAPIERLVFGGHEVRPSDWAHAAQEICEANGSLPYPTVHKLRADLARLSQNIRPGTLANAGASIRKLAGAKAPSRTAAGKEGPDLRREVARIERDIRDFMRRNRLSRCICVNLTSTEPQLRLGRAHRTPEAFAQALADNRHQAVRPSALYAWAAARLGLPLVHFTPSNSALIPAIRALFDRNGVPYAGQDGKTGETLVKSSLAPMFKYRNLEVLAWQGYNMLGDRDGVILSNPENKAAKVESKDRLLGQILGYPLHSHVAIDYVPSLDDLKTAWDFIHFRGFLGFKMSMQFTWQGCDAILAAPLVLDMVRLADLAARRGEGGPMKHLACFFKSPIDGTTHDLHQQWHALGEYAAAVRHGDRND